MYGHDCAWGPGRKSGEHYMFMTYIYANHWRLIYINQYRRTNAYLLSINEHDTNDQEKSTRSAHVHQTP